MSTGWRFKQPVQRVWDQIESEMFDLPFATAPGVNPYDRRPPVTTGTSLEILEALRRAVEEDYRTNEAEKISWGGTFEYAVSRCALDRSAIEINTRLLPPLGRNHGSISYGRIVQRLSNNSFAFWVDD